MNCATQIKVRLYSFNQKLILTQENTNFHYTNSISTEILSKYIDFIPQPVSVEFLSKERALESGHFSVAFSKTILYQIIIKDITDRELWIEYPFEIIPPKEQQSMLELLNMLDINITDKSFIEKAKHGLVQNHVGSTTNTPKKIFSLNNGTRLFNCYQNQNLPQWWSSCCSTMQHYTRRYCNLMY